MTHYYDDGYSRPFRSARGQRNFRLTLSDGKWRDGDGCDVSEKTLAGIVPIMLIHDGILFEETDPEKIGLAIAIMQGAGRDVCDGRVDIGVDIDQQLEGGARYRDKRPMAQKMWATIMDALQTTGALPRKVA